MVTLSVCITPFQALRHVLKSGYLCRPAHLSHAWHYGRQPHVEQVGEAGQSRGLGCGVHIQQPRLYLLADLVPAGQYTWAVNMRVMQWGGTRRQYIKAAIPASNVCSSTLVSFHNCSKMQCYTAQNQCARHNCNADCKCCIVAVIHRQSCLDSYAPLLPGHVTEWCAQVRCLNGATEEATEAHVNTIPCNLQDRRSKGLFKQHSAWKLHKVGHFAWEAHIRHQ